jgi:hypothetical protein
VSPFSRISVLAHLRSGASPFWRISVLAHLRSGASPFWRISALTAQNAQGKAKYPPYPLKKGAKSC